MDFKPKEIINEWSHRVSSGMPDPKNEWHLDKLKQLLMEKKYPKSFVRELIQQLVDAHIVRSTVKKAQDAASVGDTYQTSRKRKGKAAKVYQKGTGGKDKEVSEPSSSNEKEKETKSKNKVSGNPEEGDNKVKNQMLDHGYNGMEDATGTKPAPGNPGSAFNEIVSGEGIHMLNENPNMSEQELAQQMFDQFGSSGLGLEQTQASGIPPEDYPPHINEAVKKAVGNGTLKNPDNPGALKKALKDKAIMSKCIITARSSKAKHTNSVNRTKNLQERGLMGENTKTHTFYGADDSKQAQIKAIQEAKKKGGKVLLPNGRQVDYDDAIDFIDAAGGGANPSDTSTFITDDKGNVMLQFHSDKMATSDIQDNSTLAKEGENYKEYIERTQGLDENQKNEAKAVVDNYANQMEKIEENYNDLATPIAKKLDELPIEDQVDIIEKDKGTLKKNLKKALKSTDGGVKKQYREYMPEGKTKFDELSIQEQYEIIRKITVDGKGEANDTKIINKVASVVAKRDPSIDGLDVKKNLASQRKKVVNLQRERVNELNKISAEVDGVEVGLGTLMEAEECERAFHLSLMDDHEYEPPGDESGMSDEEKQKAKQQRFKGIMDSSFDVNMGGNVVTGETLRKCTGVKNTTEMKQNFVLQEAEGKDEKGRDARFTYDKSGNITGKKVFVYAVKKGEEASEANRIGYKTYRSKTGADGKTNNTMQYSKSMRDCFEGKE
tara:strand:- start:206 stop:2368 length:2163 start_codon:yes stop_codon:yes gene_type:complete